MLSQEDWNKAYMTHDYKKLIEGSGLKLGYIADLLKMSRQTLWAKLNGKSRFTEQEATNLETVICMAPLCANGEYDIGEARHLCGLDLCEEGADEEKCFEKYDYLRKNDYEEIRRRNHHAYEVDKAHFADGFFSEFMDDMNAVLKQYGFEIVKIQKENE